MKSLLLTMSLSGTIVFLFYFVLSPLYEKHFSFKCQYGILKVALFFFLTPVSYFKYPLLDMLYYLSSLFGITEKVQDSFLMLDLAESICVGSTYLVFSQNVEKRIGCLFLLLTITLFIIFSRFRSYIKIKRYFKQLEVKTVKDSSLNELLIQVKNKLKIHGSIRLLESEFITTPMVTGLRKKVILIPHNSLKIFDQDSMYFILCHELYHIKHKDLLIKFLALIVIAVHWYNPICWFLYKEICNVSEMYCDEEITRNQPVDQVKKYCLLIIDLSTESYLDSRYFGTTSLFGSAKKTTKRRIIAMKNIKKSDKKVYAFILSVGICLTASITTLAYTPAVEIEVKNGENWSSMYSENTRITVADINEETLSLPFDFYTIDENGIIEPIKENKAQRAICKHNYVSVKTIKHTKNSKGGCKIQYYNAKKCTKCSKLQTLDCYDTETHTTCSH